jgi:uncharacterized protein (TIGR02996 family)
MSTDHDAMFRAICAEHEDDTPHLAFADWFDENDQPERAEFIRAQVEYERLLNDGSDSQAVYDFLVVRDEVTRQAAKWELIDAGIARRLTLAARIEELRYAHGAAWAADLPSDCGVQWLGFHRGFVTQVGVTNFGLLFKYADIVKRAAPPVELICTELSAQAAEGLIKAGLLPWIRGLHIQHECADGLYTLGTHPAAAGIRRLTIGSGGDDELLATALAGSPHWAGLRSLSFDEMWFDPAPAETLFRATHLRGLTTLRMEGNGWTAETVRAFTDAEFSKLTDLRFANAGLDDKAITLLANAPSLGTVRYFDVAGNNVTGRGASALLCSPHLKGMAVISLAENPVRELDQLALKDAPAGGLRLFHFHGCTLHEADVRAVVRSPRLRDLWYLDLDENGLTNDAVREIVAGFKDRCPAVIWLTLNYLEDEAADLLANWPAASALRVLELSHNLLTDFGVTTLLNSPHLQNLDGLSVPPVSEEVADAIRKRFKERGRIQ